MIHSLSQLILFLRPDAEFVCYNESLDGLVWLSDGQPPTQQELDEAIPAFEQAQADAEAAAVAARQSAVDKLAALGLTVDEISAAFGLGDN